MACWGAPAVAGVAMDILRSGAGRGEIRADIDLEAVMAELCAPVCYRLFFGHNPLMTTWRQLWWPSFCAESRHLAQPACKALASEPWSLPVNSKWAR
jgi:hypothetical protein